MVINSITFGELYFLLIMIEKVVEDLLFKFLMLAMKKKLDAFLTKNNLKIIRILMNFLMKCFINLLKEG